MKSLKDTKDIPINIVAEILGKSKLFVRLGLQQEKLPIGCAVQTSSKWTYHISYELLKNYIGQERIIEYENEKNKH